MRVFETSAQKPRALTLALLLCAFLVSCSSYWKSKEEDQAVARVGDQYLYRDDLSELRTDNLSREDSISFVTNYINTWAIKQLLLSKARINLPEERLREFERLVEEYRTDLYTRAYKEALVLQAEDTVISPEELEGYYERQKGRILNSKKSW